MESSNRVLRDWHFCRTGLFSNSPMRSAVEASSAPAHSLHPVTDLPSSLRRLLAPAMTSARLSPAANLLRNSKLFAVPGAVPLPPSRPTADVVHRSDTATSIHPTSAAIYTDSGSLSQGDWGLKRPLPGKAFHKTKTPVIRLRSDVDTREHIADFDSAADHALTLQKWENYPLVMSSGFVGKGQKARTSAFHPALDNTTAKVVPVPTAAPQTIPLGRWNDADRQRFLGSAAEASSSTSKPTTVSNNNQQVSLEETLEQYRHDYAAEAEASGRIIPPSQVTTPPVRQKTRRWRYEGPWLAGMTNADFEEFLKQLDGEKIGAFRKHLKKGIVARRQKEHAASLDEARAAAVDAPAPSSLKVSEEEVTHLLRDLREKTDIFATEIASFLDLPDGLPDNTRNREWSRTSDQGTAASPRFQSAGPPRTHPSAGFSYLRSDRYATMSPKFGPQNPYYPVPARHLKQIVFPVKGYSGINQSDYWGVGGFIASIKQTGNNHEFRTWRTTNGGPKTSATVDQAFVASDGSVQLVANLSGQRLDENNVPVVLGERQAEELPRGSTQVPQLDHNESRRLYGGRPTPALYARTPSRGAVNTDTTDALDEVFLKALEQDRNSAGKPART